MGKVPCRDINIVFICVSSILFFCNGISAFCTFSSYRCSGIVVVVLCIVIEILSAMSGLVGGVVAGVLCGEEATAFMIGTVVMDVLTCMFGFTLCMLRMKKCCEKIGEPSRFTDI